MRKLTMVTVTLMMAVYVSFSAYANTWYVKIDGNDARIGNSWANAKATIQAGIDAASDGNTVLVKYGTYNITSFIDYGGKNIKLASDDGTHLSYNDAATDAEQCIIDAGEKCRVFYFHNGETLEAVVDGFTITNGRAKDGPEAGGSGIWCWGSSPTINNNIITGNSAYRGSIYCRRSSSPMISNNTITGNSAREGGGIACHGWDTSPTIENNTITGNTADIGGGFGGGIWCYWGSSPTINNNIITKNTANRWGGGISCELNSSPTISNNTITENTAEFGGGISLQRNLSITISNTILWGNNPPKIYFGEDRNPNKVTISYSNVQGGQAGIVKENKAAVNWGNGNIDAVPMFVDPNNGNYYLQAQSPCLSSANCQEAPAVDMDGRRRPAGSGCDMGAYEQFDDGSIPTAIGLVDKKIITWGTLKYD